MVVLIGGPLYGPGIPWLVARSKPAADRWLRNNGYVRQPNPIGRSYTWHKQLAQCTVWCRVEQIATVDAMPIDVLK